MIAILQSRIEPEQRAAAAMRLPAMQPVQGSWLRVDDGHAAQLAEKARLIAERRAEVLDALPGSEAAQAEALQLVLTAL